MQWGHRSRKQAVAHDRRRRDPRDELTGLASYAAFVHASTDALADPEGAVVVLLVDLEGVVEATRLPEDRSAVDQLSARPPPGSPARWARWG